MYGIAFAAPYHGICAELEQLHCHRLHHLVPLQLYIRQCNPRKYSLCMDFSFRH